MAEHTYDCPVSRGYANCTCGVTYQERIRKLEQENAALKSRPEYTHGYEDGKDSRQGEIDALFSECESLKLFVEIRDRVLSELRAKLDRADRVLLRIAANHTCHHHPALLCQACIAHAYFESEKGK